MSRIKLLLDVVNDMESLTESLRTLANAIASDEPSVESEERPSTQKTQEVKPVAKTISVEDVRAVLTPISQSGKTAQVKALLIKHGANRLSDIDPSEYESLLADAEVLANGDQGDLLANNNIREKVRTRRVAPP